MSVSTDGTADKVAEFLENLLVDLGVEREMITPTVTFDMLDIDSLDLADVVATVEREYGVRILRADLADVTFEQLVQKITRGRTR